MSQMEKRQFSALQQCPLPVVLALGVLTLCASLSPSSADMVEASVGELFTYKIEPTLFNWTHQVINEQYRYRPSLRGYPDLPSWMRFMFSHEYQAGYLYGTPPDNMAGKSVELDIVCLNKQNYETRQVHFTVFVAHKFPATNIVQMKIDNLNWVHLMDPGRVENLLNIFRKELWPESADDLGLVFMESAVNMGGRLPLRPQQKEGVIVHLGSFAPFSARIKELQDEVRPLYKLTTCTYKRTSVQKIFENVGFKLDWCTFRITGAEINPAILYHNHGYKAPDHLEAAKRGNHDRWQGMAREDAPSRNYIDEAAFAFAIPGVLFAVLLGFLSVVLCFHHQRLHDPHSEFFFQNIFHICEESCAKTADNDSNDEDDESTKAGPYVPTTTSSTVQMVHCSDSNGDQHVTTLKSLKDPNCLLDNTSINSQSPSNNLYSTDSASNTYVRPKPPPYKGGTLGRSGVDI